MTVDEVLEIVDSFLKQEKLSHLQELIFRQSWQGKTYREIAARSGYTEEYIRDNGSKLWQLLSRGLEKKVTKQNFKLVLEKYYHQQQVAYDNNRSFNYHRDWEEAIDVSLFCGRNSELTTLQQAIAEDKCRLLGVFGIGGIGKTSLTVKLAHQVASEFEFVIWRSLRNAPPINDLLASIIQFLSQQQEIKQNLPPDTGSKISKLIAYLRSSRCLLVLDNGETILQSGTSCGRYREGYEGYGELFKRIGEISHQSCLVLTSREKPQEFTTLEGDNLPVRSFLVRGLEANICQSICQSKGKFYGSQQNWQTLTYNYSGNPLAFKIVAGTIKDLFSGDIEQFLQQNIIAFDDIEDLLSEQFDRLSELEQEIMYWLAIEREPITINQLQQDLLLSVSSKKLLEAIKSLKRRSLIEPTVTGFTQQPVVMEYLIERQIEQVAAEIVTQTPKLLATHALIKAETIDYVRESQKRLTLQPLANILTKDRDRKTQVALKLRQIIDKLKGMTDLEIGYAVGNIINLLQQLKINLTNFDFSHTSIRQAYLNSLELHQVKLNHSHVIDSVFSESLDNVFTLTFNSQGNILASGHINGDIYLWSIPTGEKLQCWSAYQNRWFDSLAFSPDDRILASSNSYEDIKLWDLQTGKLFKSLLQQVAPYSNLVFLDRETLIFANLNNQVCLWNINTGEYVATLTVETKQILAINVSPDGKNLACGCVDGIIKVWDLQTYQTIKTFQLKTSIPALAFAPDCQSLFLSCIDNNSVKQWEYKTDICLKEFKGHMGLVMDLDISSNTGLLATGSFDNTVRLWQIDTGECLNVLQDHKNNVCSVAFSSDGKLLASAGNDSRIKLWSISEGISLKTLQGYQSTNWSLAFSPNGQQIASGFDDYSVRLWDVNTGNCLKNLQKHDAEIRSLAWHPLENIIVSGDCRGQIKIWDIDTNQCFNTISSHKDWVNSLAFSSDGQFLASGSRDQRIIIWNPKTGDILNTLTEPDGDLNLIWSVAFHPHNSSILVSGGYSSAVNLWNINTGKLIRAFTGHQSFIESVVFSSDGSVIASSSYDRTIKLWDTVTGECLKTLQGHTNRVYPLTFSPDGSMIASGSFDGTVKIWQVDTGRCVKTITESNIIMSVGFNSEGTILAIGIRSGEIKFWNLETEKYQQTLQLPRIYEQMDITGVIGLSETQKNTLKILGAVENN